MCVRGGAPRGGWAHPFREQWWELCRKVIGTDRWWLPRWGMGLYDTIIEAIDIHDMHQQE